MELDLKVGDYVRYKCMINRIVEIVDEYIIFDIIWLDDWADEVSSMKIDEFIEEYKPQVSDKLIDLIEVGDYVNGHSVKSIQKGVHRIDIGEDENYVWVYNENIKSIVTREQFKQMSYENN